MAHRLFRTPGKCQRIHGHSYKVVLRLTGAVDENGLLAGIDYGTLKTGFRGFLDGYLDHHVLINEDDPLAGPLTTFEHRDTGNGRHQNFPDGLPGIRRCVGDPTTENVAMWIGDWAANQLSVPLVFAVNVTVHETAVNQADYSRGMNGLDPQTLTDVLGRMRKQ
jgi:6-pyruvoyl-tetrahydropterin synthase